MHKNSRPYKILKSISVAGGILLISALSPASGSILVSSLLKEYLKNKKFKREHFLQDLKRLQDRKLISYKNLEDGEVEISLTKLGKKKVVHYKIDELKLNDKIWDKKWRLVIFDIPENKKRAREALRKKIREMNFYPLQKSVFLTPYPCEDELDFICSIFELNRNNILLLEISNFEGEEKLRNFFKLN
jgi:CRISPR-associated endonuclease Cas2